MRHTNETIRFRIPADVRHVAMVRRAIQSIATSLGFAEDTACAIELSVAEAVTNAIEHGSPNAISDAVVVLCKIADDKLVIDVRDEGTGFTHNQAESPEIWSEHGRGLRLIYEMMDNVHVRTTPGGSCIRMVKEKKETTEYIEESSKKRLVRKRSTPGVAPI